MKVRIQQDAHLFSYRLATSRNKKPETKECASIRSGTPDKRSRDTLRSSQKYQIEPTGTRFGTVRTTGLRSMEHASCQTEAPDKTSRNPLFNHQKSRNKNRESRFASARNAGLRVANQDGKKRGANYDAKRNKKTGLQYCNG